MAPTTIARPSSDARNRVSERSSPYIAGQPVEIDLAELLDPNTWTRGYRHGTAGNLLEGVGALIDATERRPVCLRICEAILCAAEQGFALYEREKASQDSPRRRIIRRVIKMSGAERSTMLRAAAHPAPRQHVSPVCTAARRPRESHASRRTRTSRTSSSGDESSGEPGEPPSPAEAGEPFTPKPRHLSVAIAAFLRDLTTTSPSNVRAPGQVGGRSS